MPEFLQSDQHLSPDIIPTLSREGNPLDRRMGSSFTESLISLRSIGPPSCRFNSRNTELSISLNHQPFALGQQHKILLSHTETF
jgi:hypothetical protein